MHYEIDKGASYGGGGQEGQPFSPHDTHTHTRTHIYTHIYHYHLFGNNALNLLNHLHICKK